MWSRATGSAPSLGTTTSTWNSTSARRARAQSSIRSTFVFFSDQLAYIINHAEDKVIFVDATLLPLLEGLGDQIDSVEHFVLFNGPHGGVETELPGQIHDYETLIAAADDEYSWRVEGENQAMGLCYTSGTTGHPKGALYSHRSMYLHTVGSCQAAAIGPDRK